jgi:DNA-binding PadR family transcriptional regulator
MMPANSDLPPGALNLLILKVVATGPVHGYAIAQSLGQASLPATRGPACS